MADTENPLPGSPDWIPNPTVTEADKVAARVIAAIDEASALIARLEHPHPAMKASVRGARTVSKDFVRTMGFMVRSFERLEAMGYFDPERAKAAAQFEEAFLPVLRRAEIFTAALSYTLEALHAGIAGDALRMYQIVKGMVRDPDDAEFGSYLEQLKRDLGRKGNKTPRKTKEPVAE